MPMLSQFCREEVQSPSTVSSRNRHSTSSKACCHRLAQPQLRNDVQALISTILSAPRLVVIPSDETLVRDMLVDLATYARSLEQQLERAQMQLEQAQSPSSHAASSTFRSSPANFNGHSEDNPQDLFSLRVKKVSLDRGDQSYQRHVGSSSHFMFMRTALEIRDKMSSEKESLGFSGKRRNDLWDEFWIRQPVRRLSSFGFFISFGLNKIYTVAPLPTRACRPSTCLSSR